jgi:hypothetical protein
MFATLFNVRFFGFLVIRVKVQVVRVQDFRPQSSGFIPTVTYIPEGVRNYVSDFSCVPEFQNILSCQSQQCTLKKPENSRTSVRLTAGSLVHANTSQTLTAARSSDPTAPIAPPACRHASRHTRRRRPPPIRPRDAIAVGISSRHK